MNIQIRCPIDGEVMEFVAEDEKEQLYRCTKCHFLYTTGKQKVIMQNHLHQNFRGGDLNATGL